MQRRTFVRNGVLAAAAAALPWRASADEEAHLIYISPLKTDGALSRCQAEVWYVRDGADMVVVTAADAWRARAIAGGLKQTQVWVGDVGQWQRSGGRYKKLPGLVANGGFVEDAVEQVRLLEKFGGKYADEWGTWGPRFRNGLADGSRVMLRYQPA